MDNFNSTTEDYDNFDDTGKSSPILIPFLNKTCDIFLWVSFALSTVVFVTLLVVIKKKSPKEMRIYKWYIMSNVVATYTYDFFMQACHHPTAVLPTSKTILLTSELLNPYGFMGPYGDFYGPKNWVGLQIVAPGTYKIAALSPGT
jgi:hypothetical protein